MNYKRILIKLSGESLAGTIGHGIDDMALTRICQEIKSCQDQGYEIAIVVGGGNFWRGRSNQQMERNAADNIGILATIMNTLALSDKFKQLDCEVSEYSSIELNKILNFYNYNEVIDHIEKKKILIFGGGVGSPFFSTDTAAALRAAEIKADLIIKATNVDGIYTADPKLDINAKKITNISHQEVLSQKLKVFDLAATSLCLENNIPILVIDINQEGNLLKSLSDSSIGTLVE